VPLPGISQSNQLANKSHPQIAISISIPEKPSHFAAKHLSESPFGLYSIHSIALVSYWFRRQLPPAPAIHLQLRPFNFEIVFQLRKPALPQMRQRRVRQPSLQRQRNAHRIASPAPKKFPRIQKVHVKAHPQTPHQLHCQSPKARIQKQALIPPLNHAPDRQLRNIWPNALALSA